MSIWNYENKDFIDVESKIQAGTGFYKCPSYMQWETK